ncbi:MAG TPA: aldo/keto reductase, partial [Porphyromonadaceae bacterium]|nr:aldo/keto reductase [Porphyromonadaceae bacterium]
KQETVSNIVIGARNEQQLIENLGAVDWSLSKEHLTELNTLTAQTPIYPHWVGER